MDTSNDQIQELPDDGPNTVALFLGLYLVILAFFILLVTISTIEETKSKKVMDSLSSTFTSIVPPSADLQSFKSKDGDVLAGQEFQQQVTGIFSTALGIDKVDTIQPGRQMRLVLKADSLFFQGEAKIRPALFPMLDRMVAALSSRPAGLRFDMEFVIGAETSGDGKTMPTTETLELKRAGAFANELNARGIPPDSIAVGMRPGHVDEVTLWFYTRDIEKSKLKFTEEDRLSGE
ncbi:MAG: hypothetical protein OQK24_05525 [Magnetovibrio sp.]|nr:hypothetical protein [Magnetovibrio sp.]